MSRPRFFIIDVFAHIFRAYYAVRHIDNNAVFGFTLMLNKLLETENPEFIGAAFDSPGPTFRKEMYPEYKANRPDMPEDLRPQIDIIKEVLNAYKIPIIGMPGFEADDIIGTLASKASEMGYQAVIVSGDKDMLQLVEGENIVMYDAAKGVEYLGEEGIPELFGCKPNQVIDLLTIWGDSSDNVPGVPGVGQKGAKKLLETYGTLESIYENLDQIKRKSYREGFEKAREWIDLSRDLVTIRRDLDVSFEPEVYKNEDPDDVALTELFTRLKFKSLLEKMDQKLKKLNKDYQLLDDEARLKDWVSQIREKGTFVFDVETTSLNPLDAELVGMALSIEAGDAAYVPLAHEGQDSKWRETATALLKPLFADEKLVKCAHNTKYDYSVLQHQGWELAGVFDDTMLMSYLLDANSNKHGLDDLAEGKLHYQTIHYEDLCGSGDDAKLFNQVPLQDACNYAAEDADVCIQLRDLFLPQMKEQDLMTAYEKVERPLVPVLSRMEMAGIRVDETFLANMSGDFGERIENLETQIFELAGEKFNIKSTKQLGEILFEKLGLAPVKKTSKTKSYSTDQSVLEKLAAKGHELPEKLLEYRMLTKLKSTYIDALPTMIHPKSGRVHSSFNQFIAATGRLSSNNPNLQNIPIRTEAGREIRAAFVPREGWCLVAADYSQIELRLMAHFSKDQTLLEAFRSGEDIHRRTASEIMDCSLELVTDDMRRAAKSINFGLIYGMGEFRLAQELGVTRKQAGAYIKTYFEKMPNVLNFRDKVIEDAREMQEVRTLYGHRRRLPELASKNKNLQAQGARLAVNTLIQGTAAEVIKLAMIELDAALRSSDLDAVLLLQVHDELVLECPVNQLEAVSVLLRETMERVVKFDVPLTVDVHSGKNWKEAK